MHLIQRCFCCFRNVHSQDFTSAIVRGPQIHLRSTPGQVGFLYRIRSEQHHNARNGSRGPAELSVIFIYFILIHAAVDWSIRQLLHSFEASKCLSGSLHGCCFIWVFWVVGLLFRLVLLT